MAIGFIDLSNIYADPRSISDYVANNKRKIKKKG